MRCCVIRAWHKGVVAGIKTLLLWKDWKFMRSNVLKFSALRFASSNALLTLVLAVATTFAPASQAQVYRIVGPDGKVTFSDKAPAQNGNSKVSPANVGAAGGAASAGLPFELRQVATKYPVTLYVGDNCGPCGAGRSMLTSRGIPFAERTINTNEDAQALQRLSGDSSLPFLTIGSQQLKGFSDTEWTQFLDAAGYPPSSTLPPGYRRPAASPLVAVAVAPPAAAPGTAAAPATRPAQPAAVQPAPNDNPAGIKF